MTTSTFREFQARSRIYVSPRYTRNCLFHLLDDPALLRPKLRRIAGHHNDNRSINLKYCIKEKFWLFSSHVYRTWVPASSSGRIQPKSSLPTILKKNTLSFQWSSWSLSLQELVFMQRNVFQLPCLGVRGGLQDGIDLALNDGCGSSPWLEKISIVGNLLDSPLWQCSAFRDIRCA